MHNPKEDKPNIYTINSQELNNIQYCTLQNKVIYNPS